MRASPAYRITAESLDGGGNQSACGAYANNGSLPGEGALTGVASPTILAKSSWAGQLYEVTSVAVSANPGTVNELQTSQLQGTATLDDASFLTLSGSDLQWSMRSGSIVSISSNGLVSTGNVYADATATVSGTFRSQIALGSLSIRNVGTDDFGIYAGDGLPDSWQVQYFGENNPLGAPGVDADGTGQTNLFKYMAGLNPLDPAAVFSYRIEAASGNPGQVNLVFGPTVAGRTYVVERSSNLGGQAWQPLSGAVQSDKGLMRTMTDVVPGTPMQFYRVKISIP